MAENEEIKVKIQNDPESPRTPSALKNARESLSSHIGHELGRMTSHILTDSDAAYNLFSREPVTGNENPNNQVRSEGSAPFGGTSSASTLKPQAIRERSPEAISGTDVVAALNKLNTSVVTGFNTLGSGINTLTLGQTLTNSNLNKVSSLLGTINTSIDKQRNILDDISDSLSRNRYGQPEKMVGFGGMEGAGRGKSIGPTIESKSASQEKTEDDLKHNIMEALKEGIVKAGEFAAGVWGGFKIGGAAPVVEGALGGAGAGAVAKGAATAGTTAAEIAPAATTGAAGLGLGGAATIAGTSLIGGLPGTVGAPWLANKFKETFPNVHARYGESYNLGQPVITPGATDKDFLTPEEMADWGSPKHEKATDVFERMRHSQEKKPKPIKKHSLWDTFQREFGIAPAEGKESLEPVQESALSKANPEVVKTTPTTNEIGNTIKDTNITGKQTDIKGDIINLTAREFRFNGNIVGLGTAGTQAAQTGSNDSIMDKMKAFMGRAEQPWKDLAKIPEDFKQGYKKAQESMTQQGHDEARKAFLDRSGITRRADELNRGSATMGMPVDVNQPGLYTGGRMEAPQGIGGAGGHFGVGGITMPETPGGLGVRGIRGASGAGPAFQQHGLSGGPIRVQPRQRAGGGSSGGGGGKAVSVEGKPVPPELLKRGEELLKGGAKSTDLQDFMSKNGYPMNGNWCGEFAASVVKAGGGTPPKDAAVASNWLKWGEHVEQGQERPGDIAVRKTSRYGGKAVAGQPGSHVGLVSSIDKTGFNLEAGNQGRPIIHHEEGEYEYRRPRQEEAKEEGGTSFKPSESDTRADRNFNPGNIAFGPWAKSHGATGAAGTDTGHGVAVFSSPQAGFEAMKALAAEKYGAGRKTANQLIAAPGGWTPGNKEAAANVARSMGLGPNDDLHLDNPAQMKKFQQGLATQEGAPKLVAGFRKGSSQHKVAETQKPEPSITPQEKQTTTPRSIPTYKAAVEEPKPTQAAPQGVKEASQATPFLSPENTTYTSKQAHMVRGQVEMGNNAPVELVSTSPPPKPDSPEQVRKNDLAASEMVNKWQQNWQGTSGQATPRISASGRAVSKMTWG